MISADSHVLEPHDLWTSRLAGGPFADRAPKMVEDESHGHVFVIEGLRPFPVGLAGAAGKSSKELRWTGDQVESLRSGGWDPVARLADMDTDGVAAEVLYPSVGMTLAQSKDVDVPAGVHPRLQRLAGRVLRGRRRAGWSGWR